jgi:hypothetical protein
MKLVFRPDTWLRVRYPVSAALNNVMHPTLCRDASHVRCVGALVILIVIRLMF